MGATNVRFAFQRFGHLQVEHPWPMLVLVALANVTLDDESDGRPARTYWGGFAYLAERMDGTLPAEPDADDNSEAAQDARRARENRFRAIRRAYPVLIRAGALTRARRPAPGRPTQYRLDIAPIPTTNAGRSASYERGTPSAPNVGRSVVGTQDAQRPHRKNRNNKEQETGQPSARLLSHQELARSEAHDQDAARRRTELDRYGADGLALMSSIRSEHPDLSTDDVVGATLVELDRKAHR